MTLSELRDHFADLQQRIENYDPRKVVEAKIPKFSDDIRDNFLESRSPAGQTWEPLHYRIGMPLILTGDLMTGAVDDMRQGEWFPESMTFWASFDSVEYGHYHQRGFGNVAARPFWGFREETVRELEEDLAVDFMDSVFLNQTGII